MNVHEHVRNFIDTNDLPGLKNYIENNNIKISGIEVNPAIKLNRYEIFLYIIQHLNDTKDFESAIRSVMYNIDFFKSLVLNYGLNLLTHDGLILIIAKKLPNKEAFKFIMSYLRSNNIIIDLNNNADIEKLSDYYVTQAKDSSVYPIGYVYDPLIMIKYGFLPDEIYDQEFFINYVNGMSLNNIGFWYGNEKVEKILSLNTDPVWSYKTLETYKRNGIVSATSLPLILYAPELVYNISKRPVNDMALFRGPLSNKIRRNQVINNAVIINNEKWNVIPVTRYAEGMSKGLFHTNEDDITYCGTFYYYEPESTTLLAYKTSGRFFNKYIATKKLNDDDFNELLEEMDDDKIFMAYVNGKLPRNLIMTPSEYIHFLNEYAGYNKKIELQKDRIEKYNKSVEQIPHYVGTLIGLYASEDDFDQPLCTLGKMNNLDIIILEYMPGSFQIVTEILDTRDREDSFRSLMYIID